MKKYLNNNKGFVLLLTTLALVFALGIGAAFLMRSVSDKRITDREKFSIQADFFAESGANHGLSELRRRIRVDLKNRISSVANGVVIRNYFTSGNSLGFLRDYAYATGETQFSVANDRATLPVQPLNVITGEQGSYGSQIIITKASNPTNPMSDVYEFSYNFDIVGAGSITTTTPSTNKNVSFSGSFTITVRRDNFAKFALFTNQHRSPGGSIVWFTERTNFFGPVSTNDRFSFANNPSGHFTQDTTQHLTQTRFYNNGNYKLSDSDRNGNIDVPVFDMGFERGVGLINLESAITSNDLKVQALGTMQQPGQNGIYVPNSGGNVTGGIYIRGDSAISLGVDAGNNPAYTIAQGGTTKVVTVNYAANTTSVRTVGGSTSNYNGIPDGVNNDGILIYSKDDITGLSGIVQKDSRVTVSSEDNIVITNHIRYQEYNAGPPVNATDYSNMLGILAWGGDVRIGAAAPNNVDVHGIVMAPHGVFTVDNYDRGSARGTATLLGGVITDFYGPFGTFSGSTMVSGYGRNFVYDDRVLAGNTPPYFPYMTNFVCFDDGQLDNRPLWKRG